MRNIVVFVAVRINGVWREPRANLLALARANAEARRGD
jgi:hypothetical protein